MPDERQVVVIGSGPAGAAAARELVAQGHRGSRCWSPALEFHNGMLLRLGGQNLFRRTAVPAGGGRPLRYRATRAPLCYAKLAPGGLVQQLDRRACRASRPRISPKASGCTSATAGRSPTTELAPYYEKVERYMDISADPPRCAAAARRVRGLPKPPSGMTGTEVERAGRAPRPGLHHLSAGGWPAQHAGAAWHGLQQLFSGVVRPLLRKPDFRLLTGAHALQLRVVRRRRRKVDGVLYFNRRTGATERIDASAVVVACGPLASTKLLHNSTSGDFPAGPGQCSAACWAISCTIIRASGGRSGMERPLQPAVAVRLSHAPALRFLSAAAGDLRGRWA